MTAALWPAVAPDPDPQRAVEQAAAKWTVAAWGIAAVWVAPTEQGAALRAALHLRDTDPSTVVDALTLWAPS